MILNHKFILIAFVTLLAASFAGCSGGGEDELVVTPDNKEVLLRLVVNIAKQPASRADNGPDYFEGPEGDFENIQTLRVIIIKDANNGNGEVEANKLVKTYASGQPANDILEFKVATGSKRVYLIANEATLPVPAAVADKNFNNSTAFLDNYVVGSPFNSAVLYGWIVSLPGGNPSATQSLYSDVKGATGLPLTEFFDFNVGAEYADTEYDETQTVHLFMTRAAAKASFDVVVANDYKGSGVSITGIRLNGLNWQQWVFPRATTYSPAKEVVINPGLPSQNPVEPTPERYITSFVTPKRVNDVTGANITMNFSEQEQIAIDAGNEKKNIGPVYFPESIIPAKIAENPAAAFSVQVQLASTQDENGNWSDAEWLTAKQLGLGDENNIQLINGCQAISRNTHLKVTINFSDKEITARVTVVPYIGVDLKPIFGTE